MIVRVFGGTSPYPFEEESTMEKPLAAPRGILFGVLLSGAFWAAIGLLVWWMV